MRVILIEDDQGFAEECCRRMFDRDHDVVFVTSAERAQSYLLGDSNFDVAIIDLMLSKRGIEGISLLRHIRSVYGSIVPVMITYREKGTTEIVSEAMRLGARDFIDKNNPLFFDKLELVMEKVMHEAKANIFLSHGHNELLKLKLKDFLQSRLGRRTIILSEQPNLGLTVVEKLERVSQSCSFAVVLMTKDDELAEGGLRARQNVVHEIGFFQGRYGRNNVVLLAERDVEVFSNISGIVRIDFEADHFADVFEPLRSEIEAACPKT